VLVRETEEKGASLKRVVGLGDLTALGLGAIIGTGIFGVIGEAIASSGRWRGSSAGTSSTACPSPPSVGWGEYHNSALDTILGVALPESIAGPPGEGGTVDIPAVFIVLAIMCLLVYGVRESARTNSYMVIVKIAALPMFIAVGVTAFSGDNFEPFYGGERASAASSRRPRSSSSPTSGSTRSPPPARRRRTPAATSRSRSSARSRSRRRSPCSAGR
jgi:basic amino acid/polyamine antiporter, APA family